MRKRIACVTAAILSISLGVSGCGLIPFEQDIPFLSSRAENVETEKKTEQQTIDEQDADTEKSTEDTQQDDGLNEGEQTDNEDTEEADEKQENPMEQAALMAVQYDYDGAIELLKSQPDYESNTDMQSAVSDYENTKATCTEYPLEQITQGVADHSMLSGLLAAVIGFPLHSDVFSITPIIQLLRGMFAPVALTFTLSAMVTSVPSVVLLTQALKPKAIVRYVGILVLLTLCCSLAALVIL